MCPSGGADLQIHNGVSSRFVRASLHVHDIGTKTPHSPLLHSCGVFPRLVSWLVFDPQHISALQIRIESSAFVRDIFTELCVHLLQLCQHVLLFAVSRSQSFKIALQAFGLRIQRSTDWVTDVLHGVALLSQIQSGAVERRGFFMILHALSRSAEDFDD